MERRSDLLGTTASRIEDVTYRSGLRFLAESLEGLVLGVLVFVSWPMSRRWLVDWGSTAKERSAEWPGDRLVTRPETIYTRAIDIAAPPAEVWPWIVQFGLGRAGFYSYEFLERMAGIPVRNVESEVPALQSLGVGDEILLHPKAPGIPVAEVSPEVRLCFGVSEALEERFELDPARSWSFYVEPAAGTTRLLVRGCIERPRKPGLGARIGLVFDAPIDFLMEQRMLRTLRRLAQLGSTHATSTAAR